MAEAAMDEKVPAQAPASSVPMKLLLIIVAVALVVGVGGAFLMVKLMGGRGGGGGEAASEHAADVSAKADGHGGAEGSAAAGAPGLIFETEPFIVNLADAPDIRYLKLTVKLEVQNETVLASLSGRVPQLRDTILVLLSSKDAASIRTPQGKFQLRDEITQRINALLPKPGVKTVYFTDFVVQ